MKKNFSWWEWRGSKDYEKITLKEFLKKKHNETSNKERRKSPARASR